MDLFPWLQQSPLLQGFTDDGVRIIESICIARQFEAGTPIFVDKMPGESAFLLASGEVAISVQRSGSERELGVLSAPDAFGELALLSPGPRRVTARARTMVGVIEIPRRDFVQLQKQRPQACLKFLMNINERFAQKAAAAAPALERLIDIL